MEAILETETAENSASESPDSSTEESAPETKTNQDSTEPQVEGTPETVSSSDKGDISKGLKTELFKKRQTIRELKAQLAEFQAQGASKSAVADKEQERGTSESKSLFDDPEGFMANREKNLMKQIGDIVSNALESREKKQNHLQSADAAEKWLLSQTDFKKDPEAIEDVKDILADDEELRAVAKVSPKYAAELAYSKWRKSKGLDRDTSTSIARGGGVGPSASSSNGTKVWTVKELETYLDPKHPDLEKRHAEVLKAQKEGRIKL